LGNLQLGTSINASAYLDGILDTLRIYKAPVGSAAASLMYRVNGKVIQTDVDDTNGFVRMDGYSVSLIVDDGSQTVIELSKNITGLTNVPGIKLTNGLYDVESISDIDYPAYRVRAKNQTDTENWVGMSAHGTSASSYITDAFSG
jgi:hypothetical protein